METKVDIYNTGFDPGRVSHEARTEARALVRRAEAAGMR